MRKNRFLQFFILFAVAVGIFSFVGMTDVKAGTTTKKKVTITVEASGDAGKGCEVTCHSNGFWVHDGFGDFKVDENSTLKIKVKAKDGYGLGHLLEKEFEDEINVGTVDTKISICAYSTHSYLSSGTPSASSTPSSTASSTAPPHRDLNERKEILRDGNIRDYFTKIYGGSDNFLSDYEIESISDGGFDTTLKEARNQDPPSAIPSTPSSTPSPSKAPNRGYAERVKLLEGPVLDYFYEKGLWKTFSSMSNEEFDSWLKKAQGAFSAIKVVGASGSGERFIPPTDAPTFSGFLGENNPYAMTTFCPDLMPTWPQKITVQVYGYSDRDLRETYEIYMPKNYVYQIPVFTEPADFLPVRPKEIYDSRGSWSTSEGLFTTVGGPITLKYRRCEIDHNQTLTKEYGDYYAKVSYRENGNVVTKKMRARRGTNGRIEILEFLEK